MNLSTKTIKLILRATNLANLLNIEGLLFDNDAIRGYNDVEGVVVMSTGTFDFEFDKLGLSRLPFLRSKFGLLKDLDNITVEAVQRKDTDLIEKLVFDCGKVNFEFRCASPKSIKDVPTLKLNKTPIFQFELTQEDMLTISQGATAMRCKNMTIQGKDKDVQFRFSDDSGDILNCKIDSDLETLSDNKQMSLTINLKKMLPIFKMASQEGNFILNILKNNIIYLTVDDMDVFVMPEV